MNASVPSLPTNRSTSVARRGVRPPARSLTSSFAACDARPRRRAARIAGATSARNRSTARRAARRSPRRTVARDPSANTQSSACTQRRVEPKRSVRAPAAFVDTMPPMLQNAPLDGSTGKRSPTVRARASTRFRIAPVRRRSAAIRVRIADRVEPAQVDDRRRRRSRLRACCCRTRAARATTRWARAHCTSATTSSALVGHRDRLRHNATDAGGLGVHGSRAATSSRNTPANPWPGAPSVPRHSIVVRILRTMTSAARRPTSAVVDTSGLVVVIPSSCPTPWTHASVATRLQRRRRSCLRSASARNAGLLVKIETDRRLGHEWDEWNGAAAPNGGDFRTDGRQSTFCSRRSAWRAS